MEVNWKEEEAKKYFFSQNSHTRENCFSLDQATKRLSVRQLDLAKSFKTEMFLGSYRGCGGGGSSKVKKLYIVNYNLSCSFFRCAWPLIYALTAISSLYLSLC